MDLEERLSYYKHFFSITMYLIKAIENLHKDLFENFPTSAELFSRPTYQEFKRLSDRVTKLAADYHDVF